MKAIDHILTLDLYAALFKECKVTSTNVALVGYPDFFRCYVGNRGFGHFTINPKTGEVSWITYPEKDVKEITKADLEAADKYDAGKPGTACIDELSRPEEFWKHNKFSLQNLFFYIHLIQDDCYDKVPIRTFINTEKRYEGIFQFNGETLTADQLRGKGPSRWETGLINLIDDQMYIRLAKAYYEETGIIANQEWIDTIVKPAIHETYSEEQANSACKFINLSERLNQIVSNKNWNGNVPLPDFLMDQAITWMMEAIHGAFLRYENK